MHVWVCVCVSLLTRDFTCSVGTSHYFTASFFFFFWTLWTLLLNFMVKTCVSGEGKTEVTFRVKETHYDSLANQKNVRVSALGKR